MSVPWIFFVGGGGFLIRQIQGLREGLESIVFLVGVVTDVKLVTASLAGGGLGFGFGFLFECVFNVL